MRRVGFILDRVAYVSGYVSGWVLLTMMMLIMAEVITRYVLRNPLILADEISAYLLIFISLVALGYTMNVGGHIRINFVVNMMRSRLRSWLRVGTLILFLGYSCVATVVSYRLVIQSFERGMRSNTWIMTPWWIPQLSIPIGFTLLSIALLAAIIRSIVAVRAGVDIEERVAEREVEGSP